MDIPLKAIHKMGEDGQHKDDMNAEINKHELSNKQVEELNNSDENNQHQSENAKKQECFDIQKKIQEEKPVTSVYKITANKDKSKAPFSYLVGPEDSELQRRISDHDKQLIESRNKETPGQLDEAIAKLDVIEEIASNGHELIESLNKDVSCQPELPSSESANGNETIIKDYPKNAAEILPTYNKQSVIPINEECKEQSQPKSSTIPNPPKFVEVRDCQLNDKNKNLKLIESSNKENTGQLDETTEGFKSHKNLKVEELIEASQHIIEICQNISLVSANVSSGFRKVSTLYPEKKEPCNKFAVQFFKLATYCLKMCSTMELLINALNSLRVSVQRIKSIRQQLLSAINKMSTFCRILLNTCHEIYLSVPRNTSSVPRNTLSNCEKNSVEVDREEILEQVEPVRQLLESVLEDLDQVVRRLSSSSLNEQQQQEFSAVEVASQTSSKKCELGSLESIKNNEDPLTITDNSIILRVFKYIVLYTLTFGFAVSIYFIWTKYFN